MFKQKLTVILFMFILSVSLLAQPPIKVGFVGNSITQGTSANDCYPSQLAMFLGEAYEVGNFGVSGRTLLKNGDFPIWDEQAFQDALDFNADILFIFLGTNDSKPQNWDTYGGEFYVDYISMVDTFSIGSNPPEIWAVLPPPAFDVVWDIRDSVIFNEIIPVIEQVIVDKNLKRFDFYTPFVDREDLFPDKIHPSVEGEELMAKMLYDSLTGGQIRMKQDVNLAQDQPVWVDNDLGETSANLTDNNPLTSWEFVGQPSTAVVDLGEADSTDAFIIEVPLSAEAGLQYTIEGSLDSTSWILLVDQSARLDSLELALTDTISPQEVRYVRLTITGSTQPDSIIHISELQVLRYHGGHHAHAMTLTLDRISNRYTYYYIHFAPINDRGERLKMYRNRGDGFQRFTGYKESSYNSYRASVRNGDTLSYYIVDYLGGYEVQSDTISLTYLETAVQSDRTDYSPDQFGFSFNFPNPFNPQTAIYFQTDQTGLLQIAVYNLLGERIASLYQGEAAPDKRQMIQWKGQDQNGIPVASGVYIVKMEQGSRSESRKVQLIR